MSTAKKISCDLRGNMLVVLATQRKSLRKFNLRLLASAFGQGLNTRTTARTVKYVPVTSGGKLVTKRGKAAARTSTCL